VNLPSSFNGHFKVAKLIVAESGAKAESGVFMQAASGDEIRHYCRRVSIYVSRKGNFLSAPYI
jgi:hypothetical protein